MLPKATRTGVPAAPSRNALRVLRNLALAGSAVGSFCVAAALTYDVNRRIRVAERIVENKRTIQTSAPQYDATAATRRLARMMEAAEAGEFMGIDSLKEDEFRPRKKKTPVVGSQEKPHAEDANADASTKGWGSSCQPGSSLNPGRLKSFPSFLNAVKTEGSLGRTTSSAPSEPMRTQELLSRSKIGIGQSHRSDSGASTGSADATPQNNAPSLAQQIEGLLDQDRPIEAAQLFLDTYSGNIKGVSSEMHELVLRTFYLNCKQENVFIARNVFLRLDEINEGSLLMWEMLLFALAKRGCIESVATLFIQYKHKFRVRPVLLDVLIRCLVEARRLSEAKSLLFGNLQHDRDCGLCGAFLAGLWRKTRSIELLNGQLRKLLNVLPRSGRIPSDKLFNPVLKAYVEFGKLADAEALVNLMMTKYKLPLRCRTKGLLVYGKSLNGDWEGVKQGLEEMCDSTTIIVKPRDFLQIFDRIFLEYWVSHTGPEIHDFIFYYIDKFRLVPDRVLYKHILEAFVEKGDEKMIAKLSAMSRNDRGSSNSTTSSSWIYYVPGA
ncbi:pentatricopeptide repeat protein [Aspergillus sp. HF37]|nr:pentatricopeptide repeat protein [Aspergillus sp. HF37]